MTGTGDTSVKSYIFFLETTTVLTYAADGGHAFIDDISGINFTSNTLQFAFDATSAARSLFFSFDGVNDHGRLNLLEFMDFERVRAKKVWFRGNFAGEAFRFWAW